jgi:biliverdin reductase
MEQSRRLRAAIIGSGGMGHTRAAYLAQHERASITCVSSRNPVTGAALAAKHAVPFVEDWREAVRRDDVDAVFVCTHNDSHSPIAQAALEAGKHVFVEYPLSLTLDDADRLIMLARRTGKVLHVGHDQAFVGWHLAVKQEAAGLGRFLALNSLLATPARGGARSVWRNRMLSGPPFMVGIAYVFHLVDIFGPAEWAEGTSTYEGLEESGYYRSNVSTLTCSFVRGGVAQLLYIRGFTIPREEQEQAMMFSNGFLSYRGYVSGSHSNEGILTRVTHSGPERVDLPPITLAQAGKQNTERFIAEVLDGQPVEPDPVLAREAVALALAAEQAAHEGGRVYLRPFRP